MVSPCVPGSPQISPCGGREQMFSPMGLDEFLHVGADSRWLVHVLLGLHEVLLMDAVALLLSLLPQHLLRLHLLHHRAAHPEAHFVCDATTTGKTFGLHFFKFDVFVEGPGSARRCCVPYMQGHVPGILSDVGTVAIPLVMRRMRVVSDLRCLAQVGIVYCRLVDSGGPHPVLLSPIVHPKSSCSAQNCAGACPGAARQ